MEAGPAIHDDARPFYLPFSWLSCGAKACLDAGACVDEHMIDQLILPMALAQGTSRVRGPPKRLITSLHLETAIHMGA
jgi:RNA 3'-terminal phosphate cyclase